MMSAGSVHSVIYLELILQLVLDIIYSVILLFEY